jgi:hypothetical protein
MVHQFNGVAHHLLRTDDVFQVFPVALQHQLIKRRA